MPKAKVSEKSKMSVGDLKAEIGYAAHSYVSEAAELVKDAGLKLSFAEIKQMVKDELKLELANMNKDDFTNF